MKGPLVWGVGTRVLYKQWPHLAADIPTTLPEELALAVVTCSLSSRSLTLSRSSLAAILTPFQIEVH